MNFLLLGKTKTSIHTRADWFRVCALGAEGLGSNPDSATDLELITQPRSASLSWSRTNRTCLTGSLRGVRAIVCGQGLPGWPR